MLVRVPGLLRWFAVNLNLHGSRVTSAAIHGLKTKSLGSQVHVEVVHGDSVG